MPSAPDIGGATTDTPGTNLAAISDSPPQRVRIDSLRLTHESAESDVEREAGRVGVVRGDVVVVQGEREQALVPIPHRVREGHKPRQGDDDGDRDDAQHRKSTIGQHWVIETPCWPAGYIWEGPVQKTAYDIRRISIFPINAYQRLR